MLRVAVIAAAALIALFAFYVVYEFGRFNAGYDRQAASQQRTELEVRIEHLEKDNRQMRTQLAELDTFRVGRAHEQAETAREMGNLQAQVARESQELAFYRGVVQQGAASIGVKIEQLRMSATAQPNTFLVHVALLRTGRPDGDAAGTLLLTLSGTLNGAAKTLEMSELTTARQRELRYSFRYYQNLDEELRVPAGMKPEQLVVEVHSSHQDIAPLSQTFLGRRSSRCPEPPTTSPGGADMFTRDPKRPSIDTLIGKAARVLGDVEFQGGLHLDGHIEGGVRSDEARTSSLSVSETGSIAGPVRVPSVVLNGTVRGDIHATEKVVLGAAARVEGDVYYGVIEMTLGAQIVGKLVRLGPQGEVTAPQEGSS